MLIGKIGEFGLIQRFRKAIKTDASVIRASGDDCAVLKFDKDNYQLFTCDMIVEGVDFTAKDNPWLVGRKALAVSISDIAACGGIPRYAVVSLGLPKNTSVRYIDQLSKGLFSLANAFKVNIVGGDISRSQKLVIDVSLLGIVEKECLVLRNGAKTGDIIFVSGKLGGSIKGKHLSFIPRIKESRYLVRNFKVNSMIDISDGLFQDLGHILKESNAAAVIYEDRIPVSRQAKGLVDALCAGEDFELLFTLPSGEAERLIKKPGPYYFYPIGKVTGKKFSIKLIGSNQKERKTLPEGFWHF
ncbi:MAG: thiamine-phosphate kinase [Candidatus Omnitrophota bacterium]